MLNVESRGSVLLVSLNRPEVRNAFNDVLIQKLSQVFERLPATTRVVVISGEGPCFSAGGDLNWMRETGSYDVQRNLQDARRVAALWEQIVKCPAVVIAKVHGAAFGGGSGLTAAADIAVAREDAKFAFSEVRLGLVPATISSVVVPKIGVGHARHLFTTGEAFDAAHALRIGLVHEVVSPEEFDRAVERKVKAILASGPSAVAKSKALATGPILNGAEAARLLAEVRSGTEAQEGLAAFLEKRKAGFVEEW